MQPPPDLLAEPLDNDLDEEPASARPPELVVSRLVKGFGGHTVLRGVDLTVRRGDTVAIVGGSGCGKTVLLKLMIGHLRPDDGQVCAVDHETPGSPLSNLADLDEAGLDRLRRHWGVVFQHNALLSGTVRENLSLPLECVQGLPPEEIEQRCYSAIKSVGLNPDQVLPLDRDSLSGGMAKRVALARALALRPLVMFYDEPTTGLDPHHASLIHDLIFAESRDGAVRRTTLIVTHDKDLLFRLQPRVVMLHEGRVFFDGAYTSFRESPSPIVRPYLELMPILNQRQLLSENTGAVGLT